MAANLNPGADATLVQAATNAAMANVPKDLSGTFESMAEEYGKTMRAVGESFASVAKEVGKIGGGLVKKAIENQSNITSGDRYTLETEIETYGPQTKEDAGGISPLTSDDAKPSKTTKKTTIGDELRDIRKELSSLYLKTDKKSRARKNELRAQREQFTNDIKMLDDARNITDDQLTSGNVNFQNTGKLNLAFKQGMNALGTKTGTIDEGEFEGYKLVPSRDKNGKMGFMLKDKQGNFVTGEDENGNPITSGEKPHFVSAPETKNLLEMNMDQKILDPLQKKINAQLNFGKQNVEYMGNQLVSSFRPVLDNETTLRQLSDVRLGDDSKTLREHVNGESEYSAEIFAELSSADLASMGVDEMADGKAGYTEADFVGNNVAVSNFKKVRSATFDKTNPNYDNGSHLKRLTEKHIYRTGELMHAVGNKLYTPPNNNNNNNNNNLGKSYIDSAKSYVSYEDQDKKVNQAKAGQTLYDWQGFKYITTDGGKTYTSPDGVNEPTADVLSGTRFGLSNRLGGITFGGGGGTGGGGENPFGETQANRAPDDFVTAVGEGEVDVVTYLEGMGITVTDKLGDKVEVEINGKTKTFTVDPNIASDESRANEMWKWMFENWNTNQEFKVGEVYERGGKNYTYNEDGTFTEK
jgi:hypothetical protein